MKPDAIEHIVLTQLAMILEQRGIAKPAAMNRDTAMFGAQGLLDSMGIVMLIVDIEQAVQASSGKTVSLADDRAMSQRSSPYRSVGSLTDYIASQLEGPN